MKFPKNDLAETVSLGKGIYPDWPYELVEESQWIDDTRTCVIKYENKFYRFYQHRDGSEYTDWNYYWHDASSDNKGEIECLEVFPTIMYEKTYSVEPKMIVVLEFTNVNDYNEVCDFPSINGGRVIY